MPEALREKAHDNVVVLLVGGVVTRVDLAARPVDVVVVLLAAVLVSVSLRTSGGSMMMVMVGWASASASSRTSRRLFIVAEAAVEADASERLSERESWRLCIGSSQRYLYVPRNSIALFTTMMSIFFYRDT
jgi:hypothetical protein